MTDVYEKIVSKPSRDDLTEIKGIGKTMSEKLYNANIVTVKQIAEMTPEKLSETPGIGLTTAIKFIAAAKDLLESSQKENSASHITQDQEIITVESASTPVEKYEVQEVIVESTEEISVEPLMEVEEDFDLSQPEQKRSPNKDNYSKLTSFYSSETERVKIATEPVVKVEIEEEKFDIRPEIELEETEKVEDEELVVVEQKTKEFADEIDITMRPEIEDLNEYEEEFTIEPIAEEQIRHDSIPKESKSIDFERSKDSTFESIVHQQISDTFKDAGCYEIPDSLESLKQFTNALDYLGCKVVKASDDLRILFLFPVKRFDREGTVLVNENKLELKSYSSKNDLGAYYDVEQIAKNLLQVRDLMYEDLANNQNILTFFHKYLKITLSLENGFGNKSLVFLSGSNQYKVFIEPILLCYNTPRSMEKSLVFPYQRKTNLHAVTRTDLTPLVRFLEKKYRMIEKRTKNTSSVKYYREAEDAFRSSVRYTSIPIFGYSVALLVIYFAELYFLLRLFNTIGFAVVGIYFSLLAFFYFRARKVKKKFLVQFEIPYYLQNLEYSEIDILDFKYELKDELLTQFGYECLGKHVKFGVMEQVEANTLKNTLNMKKKGAQFHTFYESEDNKEVTMRNTANNYGTKYNSFLEDS